MVRMVAETIPGHARGSSIRQKVCQPERPAAPGRLAHIEWYGFETALYGLNGKRDIEDDRRQQDPLKRENQGPTRYFFIEPAYWRQLSQTYHQVKA